MLYRANPELMVTDLGDELMVVHALTGEVMRMNATARAMWRSLPADVQTLVDLLCRTFDVESACARRDVEATLAQWRHQGLIADGS